jgi:DNA-binding response OmpR family regulator
MRQILVIDDDEATRQLIRARLESKYAIIDTGDPELAFATAIEHKPDAILLDLSMAKLSGFELCKAFSSFSVTQQVPLFIITGGDSRNAAFCKKLGASGFFEKPIDFNRLDTQLDLECRRTTSECRSEARVKMREILKLKGKDRNGIPFEVHVSTEDISANGFRSGCTAELDEGTTLEVWLCNGDEHYIGTARVARIDHTDKSHLRYGFRLQNKTSEWAVER